MRVEGQTALYEIVHPVGGGFLSWFRKALLWPISIRAAARELKDAHEVLEKRYAELAGARAVLALQATQLSVAHTISQLIHRDLDVERTLHAMAEALVNAGGYAAADVHLSTVVDNSLVELRATEGEKTAGEPILAALLSRGRVIGDVRVWHAPEHDPRERGQLLEFVLPTLSMALDNAISFRELAQYRDSLELRVAERTAELRRRATSWPQTVRSLEEAQEVRDRIFANINHEIRTPLTLVQLAVSDVKRRLRRRSTTARMHQLDGIEMSTRKLLRLVDDLLLLASGREGKLRLEHRRRRPGADARRHRRHLAAGGRGQGPLHRLRRPDALRAPRRRGDDRARRHQPHLQRRQVHAVGWLASRSISPRTPMVWASRCATPASASTTI